MKRLVCGAALAIALLGINMALADKPELQALGSAIRVSPVKVAAISPDLKLQSAWHNGGGIAQDCWGDLTFDCFEPVHRLTPWSGDMYTPTDGAAWGGWDPCCDIGGVGCGSSYRWFFGSTYCNPNVINDMTFEQPALGCPARYGMAEVAWWWYALGQGSSEGCYIAIWCAEDFQDCTAGPPGAANYYDGVIWTFGNLGHGGYYWATMSNCNLYGARLPADGDGAYQIVFASGYDGTYLYLASCAQPMLWAPKEGADWDGVPNPSSQHGLQWDDDAPPDGVHDAGECYNYYWEGYCPEVNGAMACFWAYVGEDVFCLAGNATMCGDADCDGNVDGFDIDPFVTAMRSLNEWLALPTSTCDPYCALDTNGDGAINGFDIDGFVQVVGGGCCSR